MKKPSFKNSILITAFTVGIIWCIKSAEFIFRIDLSWLGVYPQTLHGALGILTAPLIHGSLEHIFNNTLPMLVLGTLLLYGYPRSRWRVLATVWVLSGVGVWLFGRESYHIGASGLTHGVFFYLLVVSIFRRDKRSVAIMMTAFFLYGGMTMTIFPREESISFEYHFFGALAGSICALLWHSLDPKPIMKKYEWEKQPENDDPIIGDAWQTKQQHINSVSEHHAQNIDKEKPNMDIETIPPFELLLRVRYSECDPQGVVFNARYADYADLAATEFMRELIGGYQHMIDQGIDNQVVNLNISWQNSAKFDDVLCLSVHTTHVGNTSFTLQIKMFDWLTKIVVATAEIVYVMLETAHFSKIPVPPELKEKLLNGAPGRRTNIAGIEVNTQ